MYLLDTNVVSEMRRPRPDLNVRNWFETKPREALYLSVLSITEIEHGSASHADPVQTLQIQRWLNETLRTWFPGRIADVTQEIAQHAGLQIGLRKKTGRALGLADALIASTATRHSLVLVTRNVKDFVDLPVDVYDPWTNKLALGNQRR